MNELDVDEEEGTSRKFMLRSFRDGEGWRTKGGGSSSNEWRSLQFRFPFNNHPVEMRLSVPSFNLLGAFLVSLPFLVSAVPEGLAGVIDWHQPKIGIPLLHSSATAPTFVSLPSAGGVDSISVVTITQSNVIASLNSSSGNISEVGAVQQREAREDGPRWSS